MSFDTVVTGRLYTIHLRSVTRRISVRPLLSIFPVLLVTCFSAQTAKTVPAQNSFVGSHSQSTAGIYSMTEEGTSQSAPTEPSSRTGTITVSGGTTDDTNAVITAIRSTSYGGTLVLLPGTFSIAECIDPGKAIRILGAGAVAPTGFAAVIVKKTASNTTGAFCFAKQADKGSSIENLLIDGESGNKGPGIDIRANRIMLRDVVVQNQGGDGIRIGEDMGTAFNANSWALYRVTSRQNLGNGVFCHSASSNANNGNSENLVLQQNRGDGWKSDKCSYASHVGILAEDNSGWGVELLGSSFGHEFMGGDVEANAAGAIKSLSQLPNWITADTTGNLSDTTGALRVVNRKTFQNFTVGSNLVGTPSIVINGTKGSSKSLVFQSAGKIRWLIQGCDGSAEAGSNTGCDLKFLNRADDGSGINTVLSIQRSNSESQFGGRVTATGGLLPGNGPAPPCNASIRGTLWYVPSAQGIKDVFQICAKDATDNYAWRIIY